MREFRTSDRSLPLFITLVVFSIIIMTFDIRSDGEGVFSSLRSVTNTALEPLEAAGSVVVNPLADLVANLSEITSLRSENQALRALLAEQQAELAANADLAARLTVLERLLQLRSDDLADFTTTMANVVGQTDSFDLAFRIDKGEEAGILEGHPVLDDFGYLVGRVSDSWSGGAIVTPLIADINAVTVRVGEQVGTLEPIRGSDTMRFDVFENAVAVRAGQEVVTSSLAQSYPPSIPVGEIIEAAEPTGQTLTASVRPFSDPSRLRAIVVLTWPTDQSRNEDTTTTVPIVPDGPSTDSTEG